MTGLSLISRAPLATLFPYTTLFRSNLDVRRRAATARLRRLVNHDSRMRQRRALAFAAGREQERAHARRKTHADRVHGRLDRKSTRLNSSHLGISYAVFCLKKKKHKS